MAIEYPTATNDTTSPVSAEMSPVLIEFAASWCQPCKRMSDTINQVVADYGDRITHTRFDTSVPSNLHFAARQGITSIPTVMIFAGGVESERLIGYYSADAIRSKLDAILDRDVDAVAESELEVEA